MRLKPIAPNLASPMASSSYTKRQEKAGSQGSSTRRSRKSPAGGQPPLPNSPLTMPVISNRPEDRRGENSSTIFHLSTDERKSQTGEDSMKIAMIGIGKVGGTLGTRWAQKGYTVTFGARDVNSEKVRALLETAGKNASAASVREAAAGADVVVFAVPWAAVQSAIEAAGDLTGKVVVDGTNPVAPGLQLALGTT